MERNKLYSSFCQSNQKCYDGNRFVVFSIEGMLHKVGRSTEGFPKVFVNTTLTKSGVCNMNGELFSVEYNVNCSLIDENGNHTDASYSIITLRSTDEGLCKIFFDVFLMMIQSLDEVPEDIELAYKIEGLLAIFAALKRKPIKKIQGLWAELLVIVNSQVPLLVAQAWHSSPGSKYDFTKGSDKIEVKSTSGENRLHKFSLDQLNPSQSSRLLIASVIVRESAKDDNGLSVYDLYEKFCEQVADIDCRMHVYSVISNTLGDEYAKADNVYFDFGTGIDTLKFYDYVDIPKIEKDSIPPFVSGVKFDSDLSHIESIENKNIVYESDSLLGSI